VLAFLDQSENGCHTAFFLWEVVSGEKAASSRLQQKVQR